MNHISMPYNCPHRHVVFDKDVPYHDCPFQVQIEDNSDSVFCNCCESCTEGCAQDANEEVRLQNMTTGE